ncbi:hypothetical protein DFH94DRAFT_784981 [Russula ochroleuca]|uniref:Uncharacterized protein n=1 Tax=Russula ochroleuca TaxID=152965 RepID=A0A9P5JU99_9AGAM|nr:hypothetical protein DFH94DRAFT_784981 [Russula ochroleuca]
MHCPLSWRRRARGSILLGTSGPFGMVAQRMVGRRSAVLLLGLNDIHIIFSYCCLLHHASPHLSSPLLSLHLYMSCCFVCLVPSGWIVRTVFV